MTDWMKRMFDGEYGEGTWTVTKETPTDKGTDYAVSVVWPNEKAHRRRIYRQRKTPQRL